MAISSLIRTIPFSLLFSLAGYVFLVCFIVSLISYLIFDELHSQNMPWYISAGFHVSLYLLLLGFIKKDKDWYREQASKRDSESLIQDSKTLAIIFMMAGVLNVLGLENVIRTMHTNIFSLSIGLLYAGYIALCFGLACSFVIRLMEQRPHARSSILRIWIVGLSILTILLQLFLASEMSLVIHILAAIIAIIGNINTKGLQWLSGIAKDHKRHMAWTSFIIAGSINVIILKGYAETTMPAIAFVLGLMEPLIFAIGLWLLLLSCRLLLLAINSLPTADLIDKKSIEFSALSTLTASASKTGDYTHIIHTALELISQAMNPKGMYCSIRRGNETYEAYAGYLSTELQILCAQESFQDWLTQSNKLSVLHDISEQFDPENILRIQSVIASSTKERELSVLLILVHDQSYHFTPEDEIMLSAFSESVNIAIENASLLTIAMEHQKLEQEMEIAKQVQHSLLPKVIPTPIGYDIACFSLPAKMVGGDFYDVFQLRNGDTCIIIADVSGKGIPAAFWMATIKGVLLSLQESDISSPKMILQQLQISMMNILDSHIFFTAAVFVLEQQHSQIRYARAGHMPLLKISGQSIHEFRPDGIGIGMTKDLALFTSNLAEMLVPLQPEDLCLIYTDGFAELFDEGGTGDNVKSIKTLIRQSNNEPKTLIEQVNTIIENDANKLLRDDITIIALKKTL